MAEQATNFRKGELIITQCYPPFFNKMGDACGRTIKPSTIVSYRIQLYKYRWIYYIDPLVVHQKRLDICSVSISTPY